MARCYEIPLTPTPQTFSISLSGAEYQLTFAYRAVGGSGWVLDVASKTGAPLVSGIPLVTGVDLLAQYAYLGLGGRLWVQGAGDPDNQPTFDGLGVGSRLLWIVD